MPITPDLVKKMLTRFYTVFGLPEHGLTPESLQRQVEVWHDLFALTPEDVFDIACHDCMLKLHHFPLPADVTAAIQQRG